MAQTKRKRRTKHRGNAVGVVEARGRTSKPRPGETRKTASARGSSRAALKPPTLRGAAVKAFVGMVILFVFFRFLSGQENSTAQAMAFCAVAFVMYTPVMYLTDKFIYNRKLKQQAAKR